MRRAAGHQGGVRCLPAILDETKSLQTGSPLVHDGGNRVTPLEKYERGDINAGFAQADVVLEQVYRTDCEIHTPLERHGCVAKWTRGRLTVWQTTQGVYRVQSQISEILRIPISRVRVVGQYMGGGFGSKAQADKETILAALLSKKTGCPVKLFMSREETFIAAGNRPPANMRLKAGVKKDGTLTAFDFTGVGTGGAYPAFGTSLVDWQIKELYRCPNVRTELSDVYINACPSRYFRAPGHPQGSWALEQMVDALAEKIGMDPVELRLKNIATASQVRPGNPPYTSTGFSECLIRGAEAFGWKEARKASPSSGKGNWRKGVGMAGGTWFAGMGGPPSTIIAKLFADGSVNLNMGASDLGTGTRTVMALVVAEELGVRPDLIDIENADTGTTQFATVSGGSKTVPTESPAVRAAAIHVKQQLLAMAAQDLKEKASSLAMKGGRVMNHLTYDSQVIGGVTMGIGFAMTESRVLDRGQTGRTVSVNWHDYKLPTALDIPADIKSVPIDTPDDEANTAGAKGLGEPVAVPTAAAVANAIYNATGVRTLSTPVSPVMLRQALADKAKKA